MFREYRVVACTPVGRQPFLEILAKHIESNIHLIDEWQLWINTNNKQDIQFASELTRKSYVNLVDQPTQLALGRNSVARFYEQCTDYNTIYIRLDDDMVWLEPGAIYNLLNFRVKNPEYLLVYPNIINHHLCTHLHQQIGALPISHHGLSGMSRHDSISWGNAGFAEFTHRFFQEALKKGEQQRFKFSRYQLLGHERFIPNCFATFGSSLALLEIDLNQPYDDEWQLSVGIPQKHGVHNCICGQSLMAHFASEQQHPYFESHPNALNTYKNLALLPQITPSPQAVSGMRIK